MGSDVTRRTIASDDDDYEPYEHRRVKEPLSDVEVLLHLLKCAFGTGCLAMPHAFLTAGWVVGLVGTFVIGLTIIHALHVYTHGIYLLCKKHRVPHLSYTQAIQVAFEDGPKILRPFSAAFRHVVEFSLFFYSFGVCCVYVIFVAKNLKQLGDVYIGEYDTRIYMVMLILPLILQYMIRSLKYLVPLIVLASIILFGGYLILVIYLTFDLPSLSERGAVNEVVHLPLFFGTVLFSIESMGVIVALEGEMKTPRHFLGMCGILSRGMIIVITFYAAFGFIGYWHFGADTSDSIIDNLPKHELFSQIVLLFFSISIFLSYSLQGYVAFDILWHGILKHAIHAKHHNLLNYMVRTTIVVASVLCSLVFPDFGLFLSFIGSLCLSQLGLLFPALLDLSIRYQDFPDYGWHHIYIVRDFLLMFFGIFSCLSGTWTAFDAMLELNRQIY